MPDIRTKRLDKLLEELYIDDMPNVRVNAKNSLGAIGPDLAKEVVLLRRRLAKFEAEALTENEREKIRSLTDETIALIRK